MTDQHPSPIVTNDPPRDAGLENAIEEVCRFALKLKRGKQTDDQIQKRLTDAGLSLEAAHTVTEIGLARMGKDRQTGRRNILFGGLWLAGGGIIALGVLDATSGGGRYLLYGVMLLGLFQILVGLIQVRRHPGGKAEIREIVERVKPVIHADETSRWKIAAIKIHNP